MKKTIVIKVHPIGSTKNTVAKTPEKNESVVSAAPASESEIETRIIKVIKHGTNTISGIPLSELSWGDTFFVHGIPTVNYTETLDGLKRNFSVFGASYFPLTMWMPTNRSRPRKPTHRKQPRMRPPA